MISSSCSTTTTVLPSDCSSLNTCISRSVSLECRPIDGSSRIYSDPTRLLPNDVQRLMRWLSPPLSEFERRLRVRYPRPTFSRNCMRERISVSRRLPTSASCSLSSRWSNHSLSLMTGICTRSVMLWPSIFTYSASGFRRVP